MDTKVCSRCGNAKPLNSFYVRQVRGKPYRLASCIQCQLAMNREWHLQNPEHVKMKGRRNKLRLLYRITPETYAEKFAAQGGRCAICGEAEDKKLKGVAISLATDHDHSTGEIRGLLCHRCNSLIGLARERASVLKAALDYLERYGSPDQILPTVLNDAKFH